MSLSERTTAALQTRQPTLALKRITWRFSMCRNGVGYV